ncbi:alpha/beta fold hydrolase [Aldersonia kunmingensis]|uniref:alpha/beta fold hydrolase n=1 Tax=Aldersonia kunmingensis TaxID=408066 RepID=UPI0008310B22|nr:alpha/beta hydrolase [Aldersonia kunmingensis]
METTAIRVTLDGVQIAYRDSGVPVGGVDLAPVILVHGMGGDGHTWDRFAHALTVRGRRVIIVDLRGHGRSAHTPTYLFDEFAFDVLRLCDLLKLSQADFVGHSLGGYAVSVIAQVRPELVRRLVIEESPLPRRLTDPKAEFPARLPTLPELWHAATSVVRSPRAVFAFDRAMTAAALTQFHTPNPQWWQRLPDITARTLILAGGSGSMVDPDKLDAAVAAIPDCTTLKFACGHSIHRDRYRDFENAVLPFVMAR